MKKPNYCPDWFDISLYDGLSDFSRDELSMALWSRQMNYRITKEEFDAVSHLTDKEKEEVRVNALNWLKGCANEWIAQPIKHKNSGNRMNYNPLEVETNILRDVTWGDIARLHTESYVEIPEMRKFVQETRQILEECIKDLETGVNIHTDWLSPDNILPEDMPSQDVKAINNLFDMPVSETSNYSTMIHIDLGLSDEVLEMAFKQKLKELRQQEERERTRRFSDAEIRKMIDYRIFAFMDLYVYSLIVERKFTDVEMAAMIYPPSNNAPLDFDAVDRIARTVRPKAMELLEKTNARLLL